MKKTLNLLCMVLIVFCISQLISNSAVAVRACYDLGKGLAYTDETFTGWMIKMLIWTVDMNAMLIAGILFVAAIRNINRSIVFDWRNIRLFSWTGVALTVHALCLTGMNSVDMYILHTQTGVIVDFQSLIAAFFVFIVAEIFAIGLRLREDQELTV